MLDDLTQPLALPKPKAAPMPVAPKPVAPMPFGGAAGQMAQRARPRPAQPPIAVPGGQTITSTTQTGFPSAPPAVPGGTILTEGVGTLGGGTPAPNTTPMPVDRFALAQDRWNQYRTNEAEPAYQAALTRANRLGAAGGQLGAGELRTDFGNLTQGYTRDLNNAAGGFLNNALEGTVGDNQRAFENELRRLGLSDELTNSAFGRSLQAYGAGSALNPSGTGLAVGANQGANATRSGQSFADLMRTLGYGGSVPGGALPPLPAPGPSSNNTLPGAPSTVGNDLPDWLQTILRNGGGG